MNIQMKAAFQTLWFVLNILLFAVVLVVLTELFGIKVVSYLASGFLFAFGVWLAYSLNLQKLKWEQRDNARTQRKEPTMD